MKLELCVRINTLYNNSRVVEMDCVITTVLLRSFGTVTGLKYVIHLTNFAKVYNWNGNCVINDNVFIFCATAQSFGTSWRIVTEFVSCVLHSWGRGTRQVGRLKEWITFATTQRRCWCGDGKRNPVRRKSVAVTFQWGTKEPTSVDDMHILLQPSSEQNPINFLYAEAPFKC